MSDLLNAIRTHLATAGAARDPRVAGAAAPAWLEPRDGVKAPNEGANDTEKGDPVLGLYFSGGIPARPFESSLREDTVDFWIRASRSPAAIALGQQIRNALIDQRDFLMGGLRVIDCEEWRPLQPFTRDQQSFTFIWSAVFQLYAS